MSIRMLMEGIAAGDALGVTSEFDSLDEVRLTYLFQESSGWPFECVGGGPFGVRANRPTDDAEMALAMVQAWAEIGAENPKASTFFCGERIAKKFVAWLDSNPIDIGHATRSTLKQVRGGESWHRGGRKFWQNDRHAWSNGSLMRNGVVAAMGKNDYEVFRCSLHHGLITHWAPLPAICCAAQVWLIRNGQEWITGDSGQQILQPEWVDRFRRAWELWLYTDEDPVVQEWREETAQDLEEAWQVFAAADFHPDSFRPFTPITHIGFCLTTLQIGVWAMLWAYREKPYPVEWLPQDFPQEPFHKTGGHVLSWVAMIGRDADTYGATSGPMIASIADLDRDLVDLLWAVEEMPREIPLPYGFDSSSYSYGLPVSPLAYLWPDLTECESLSPTEMDAIQHFMELRAIVEEYCWNASSDDQINDVVVHVTMDYVIVAQVAYSWCGPYERVLDPIPHATRRTVDATAEWLKQSLTEAKQLRAASFEECCVCAQSFPPEDGFDTICHACMAKSGIKF